jgi:hypothetical protein
MPFRDDLEAARQEALSLQRQLRSVERDAARQGEESEGRHRAEVDKLQQRIAVLEAGLGRTRELSPNSIWLICWLPAAILSFIQILACLCWPAKSMEMGWVVCQIGLVFGILGTAVSWRRRGLLGAWAGLAALKLGVVLAWGWGWWSPFYSGLPPHGARLSFFWAAPVVLLAIVVVEGVLIRNGFRPAEATAAEIARRQTVLRVVAIVSLLIFCTLGLVAVLIYPKWEAELLMWIALVGAPGTLAYVGRYIYKVCVTPEKSS